MSQIDDDDNQRFLNGMLDVVRIGCSWRDRHERHGKSDSVYFRFRRWAEQGVWGALLQTLFDLELTHDWEHICRLVPISPFSIKFMDLCV